MAASVPLHEGEERCIEIRETNKHTHIYTAIHFEILIMREISKAVVFVPTAYFTI